MRNITFEDVDIMHKKFVFEGIVDVINNRMKIQLQFPPEHDEFGDNQHIDTLTVNLVTLFEDVPQDLPKRFFLYLIGSLDIAHQIQHENGVSLVGVACGNKSVVLFEREKFAPFDCNSSIMVSAWRQFKLLSTIICRF